MPNSRPDLTGLVLDGFGRVVLSDDLLNGIGDSGLAVSAGLTNIQCGCPGGTNSTCSNSQCDGTTNGQCLNSVSCESVLNYSFCLGPNEVPEG